MSVIAFRGLNGFVGLVLLAVATGVVQYTPVTLYATSGLGETGYFALVATLLVLPLSVRDLRRYLKTRKIQDTTLFIPVFLWPLILMAIGLIFNRNSIFH